MGVMHIPGHEKQGPREVGLDEIREGDGRLPSVPALPDEDEYRVRHRKPPCARHVRGGGSR